MNQNTVMKAIHYYLIVIFVILIDQALKMWVYFNMDMGFNGEIIIFDDWFRIHYILNEGMAFGIKLDNLYGKLFLSIFRILAITGLGYFFYWQVKHLANKGLLISLALILGGAIGNGIDSVFYGVLLEGNVSPTAITPWLHGQVIDMLYFPMFEGTFPQWFPWIGGERFHFFSAIFNIADSAIFIGAASILILHNRFFAEPEEEKKEEEKNM